MKGIVPYSELTKFCFCKIIELTFNYGIINNPIPATDMIRLTALPFVIFSPKKIRPNSAVRTMTTAERIGNWIDASIVTIQRRENRFPSVLHTENAPATAIRKTNSFPVIGTRAIFQKALR